jgi:hypothetical protein
MVRLMMAAALLGPLTAAMAGSWNDTFQMGSDVVGRAGYDAPGVPGSFFGDWEHGSFSTTLFNDTGGQAQVTGATSVGRNRLAVETSAGFLPDHWATQVSGGSFWSERLTITGGQGVGRARYSTFLDFTYGLQAEAFGNLMGSSLFLTFDWSIGQGSTLLASGTYTLSYAGGHFNEATQSAACVDAHDGNAFVACSGELAHGEIGSFLFAYGQPIDLSVTLSVMATGTASLDALHTGGVDGIELPAGAVAVYESGRTDNPLGIVAAPVPEPATGLLWLAGGLVLAGICRRRMPR